MSHHPHQDDKIVCPNCGFAATRNYCAQCGQETHLHKETFIGLITHFVGHYFHYDSKFWVTLKTLFTRPGMLTVAYWEKKRMRFIPPISLYIFVSIVFFLIFFSTSASEERIRGMALITAEDSFASKRTLDSLKVVEDVLKSRDSVNADSLKLVSIAQRGNEILNSSEGFSALLSKILHSAPKVFFFMIPIMAFVFRLLYRKRKGFYFVDHAIFSLHIHAFAFVLLLPGVYSVPDKDLNWLDHIFSFLQTILPFAGLLYLVIAIHNAYKTKWLRSLIYGVTVSAVYLFFFVVVALVYFLFVFYQSINA